MSKAIKTITHPKLSLNILTIQEVQRIHEATPDHYREGWRAFPIPARLWKSGKLTGQPWITRK